jgi:glycosyltransferase involved in cell wall biosynthesis
LTAYPPDAGVGRHVVDVVALLDPEQWQIDLACAPGSLQERVLGAKPNVRVHPLGRARTRPNPRDTVDFSRLLGLVARADVIHAHSSKAGFLTRFAAAIRGRTRQTIFTPHAWSFWAARGLEASVYTGLERFAARWCAAIVAVSRAERDAGLAAGVGREEQYRVIVNGVDPSAFAEPAPVAGRVLQIGRLAGQKRPDVAVRAFARVRDTHPAAELQLVGDGPWKPQLRQLVDELALGDAVQILGTRDDVPALLAKTACVLLTSDYEGCPYSVLEAMAAGAPVVATSVGGVPELVVNGETGFLVEPGNPEAAARAVESLLADPERARAMGEAGRARARALFSRERMVAELDALYREVSARGG